MDTATKKLFVKCWKAEYQATVKVHTLQDKINIAYRYDKPASRLENSLAVWEKKQNVACDPLIELIQNGLIGIDAATLCSNLLGDIGAYVADCYYELFLDYQMLEAS